MASKRRNECSLIATCPADILTRVPKRREGFIWLVALGYSPSCQGREKVVIFISCQGMLGLQPHTAHPSWEMALPKFVMGLPLSANLPKIIFHGTVEKKSWI